MLSLRFLLSNSYNPWFNLALEEHIFQNMPQNQTILFLWRNDNTVVIGRSQNPWKECNTRRMDRDGIRLARRYSGGGAVFHDLGNTCFTFMSTQKKFNNNISFNIIKDGLNRFGIDAIISGRNDLVVNTQQGHRKISGSAYRITSDRKFHHGTLLLCVNLNKLAYYLNPDPKKLEAKGIDSIKSRVINLNTFRSDINHQDMCQKLKEAFFEHYAMTAIPEVISMKNYFHILGFIEQFNKQRCWSWNFGNSPEFTHQVSNRFNWGSVELHFDIKYGMIVRSHIFTDSLNPFPLEELQKKIIGVLYNTQSIQNCCIEWMKNWPESRELKDVTNWLVQKVK